MSELTERLFDHRWDNPTVPEMKMLRNEAGNRLEEMEKAISIYCRELHADQELNSDEEAIYWFLGYTDAMEKGTEKEFLAQTPEDRKLEAFASMMGISVETLKEHPQFDEIMASA